jgi:signal transduction histidine kinase/HAMP domain-containing protein
MMNQEQFVQNSSIVKRLRTVMISIIMFIVFCFVAIYISNFHQLEDIQTLSTANNLLSLNTQAIESLNSTEQNMNVIFMRKDVSELRYKFEENLKVTKRLLFDSALQVKDDPILIKYINDAISALDNLEASHNIIFNKLKNLHKITGQPQIEELNADLLAASQYLMDAKEILRKIQIHINKQNVEIFTSIYQNRYRPLLISILLCVLFLTFVVTIGLAIAKNAAKSILNLLNATEKVGQGDTNYQAKIIANDEIGRVTHAFNKMVTSLNIGQTQLNHAIDRTVRLQGITEAFSEALTPDQVLEVIFKEAFESMDASAGSIAIASEEKGFLEIKRIVGYDEETLQKYKKFSLTLDIPLAEVVRTGVPIFTTSDQLARFTDLEDRSYLGPYCVAYLPLMIQGKPLGVLSFNFSIERKFDSHEKDFMIALARQSAQAIHRSQLYDDAKRAIEVRDEFLSIASHELRTPLTPLKMQIQVVARQLEKDSSNLTPERLIKMVETSDRQITRLSVLIDDLLDVTRISSGKLSLNKESFSMKEMITDVAAQYAQQFKSSQSTIDVIISDDMVGNWDRVRIEQVIINLLTNAAKYAPKKPILIKLEKVNNTIKIVVTDQGPGISLENHERIFKRFERVSDKSNIGGLGLGLYICKQIVEAHRGKIYVESIIGVGSTFTVELPEK